MEWAGGEATVRTLQGGVTDAELIDAIRAADKAGIDCPLGWPDAFVDFVGAQRTGSLSPVRADAAWRRGLAYRLTDQVVRVEAGLNPLSVSADRIAYVAFRCANLLASLGMPIDRSGAGLVVEVYPAASLRRWGLTHRGYKLPGPDALGLLVDSLLAAAPWLSLGPFEPLCRRSHDAFDAVIAALAARAAALGRALEPAPEERGRARREGWIALPTCDLGDLTE